MVLQGSHVWDMQNCMGHVLCFIGGTEEVYLWDLRNIDRPVREYESPNGGVMTLLREPRHGTLLVGGWEGITCSDFNTGKGRLNPP